MEFTKTACGLITPARQSGRSYFMKPEEKRSRHSLSYFNLLDALESDTCPICTLIDKKSKRHLHALYYEFVNDAGVRGSLHHSRGFCNWHAWASTEIPCSNTGIAIIYNDLLQTEIAAMRGILALLEKPRSRLNPVVTYQRKKDLSLAIQNWKEKDACIVCAANARSTLFYLRELVDHLNEETFAARFRASPGLCLPHLKILAENFVGHPGLPICLKIEVEKCHHLSWELVEFWRKHDYRFKKEPKGAETDSWFRAIHQFVGMREQFGNDITRAFSHSAPEAFIPRARRAAWDFWEKINSRNRQKRLQKRKNPAIPRAEADGIREALKQKGCPVCRIGNEALKNYFSCLLKQNDSIPAHIVRLREASGFCRTHAAWFATHAPDDTNTALVEDLTSHTLATLKTFIRSLEATLGQETSRRRLAPSRKMFIRGNPCPVCQAIEEAEEKAIKQFVALLNEAQNRDLKELYETSDGLCVRHLALSLQEAPEGAALFLARDMAERLATLREELRDSLKKSDFQPQNECQRNKQETLWKGLVRLSGNLDNRV